MTNLASLYGRTNLSRHLPPVANVVISNVPGPAAPLYLAGARIVHYHPVSIPAHGMALNITVQSYAGSLEFGLTACRRVVSQEESYELVGYLQDALEEIRRLPDVARDVEQAPAAANVPAPVAPPPAPKARRRQSKSAPIEIAPKSVVRRTRRTDTTSARAH